MERIVHDPNIEPKRSSIQKAQAVFHRQSLVWDNCDPKTKANQSRDGAGNGSFATLNWAQVARGPSLERVVLDPYESSPVQMQRLEQVVSDPKGSAIGLLKIKLPTGRS
jgi:hypothetical protein